MPRFLGGYLRPGFGNHVGLDAAAFSEGRLIVLETVIENERGHFDPGRLSGSAVEFRLPERRAGFMAVCFTPPREALVERVMLGGQSLPAAELIDRDFGTPAGGRGAAAMNLEVSLRPGRRYRSLVVVQEDGTDGETPECRITTVKTGSGELCGAVRRSGRFTLVSLRDLPARTVALTTSRGEAPAVVELWAYAAP
jgi:hypothetical protein